MIAYRKPPIAERAFSIIISVDEEIFQQQLPSWKDMMKETFPEYEAVTQWQLAIKEKDGMPFFDPSMQTMSIIHRFWMLNSKKKRVKGIQIRKDLIAFNLIGGPENPHHYEELKTFSDEWLQKIISHFKITNSGGINLEYVNILSPLTLPTFSTNDRIDIGRVLQCFKVPGTHTTLIPPYMFQLNMDMQDQAPIKQFHVGLNTVDKAAGPTLRLLMKATTVATGKTLSLTDISSERQAAHDLILNKFHEFFTKEALDSFQPIP